VDSELPAGFPLEPLDGNGQRLAVGDHVRVVSVASCARGLPSEDQARLSRIEGCSRKIVAIDRWGFVWLSFSADVAFEFEDFSLFPTEVILEGR
jgi:hypothetical protein